MQAEELKALLATLTKNIFYCGAISSSDKFLFIVKDKVAATQIEKFLKQHATKYPRLAGSKIKVTTTLGLDKVKSLESMLQLLPHGQIILDPTVSVERAIALVNIAKMIRQDFPQVKGCYFNGERRSIVFSMHNQVKVDEGMDLTKQLERILIANLQGLSKPFTCTIKLTSGMPQGKVIAIDTKSVVNGKKQLLKSFLNKMKWSLLIASASSTLGVTPAKAQLCCEQPAVANPNAWLGLEGGGLHNSNFGGAGGAVDGGFALPLPYNTGVQLHGYDGQYKNRNNWSIDGYIFWRKPTMGLFGPHITYTHGRNLNQQLYGLHGEGYLQEWTLVAEAGGTVLNHHRSNTGVPPFTRHNTTNKGYYAEALVHWYTLPDWDLYLGAIVEKHGHYAGQIGTEYQLGLSCLPGLSVFADIGAGQHNLVFGMLGIRYYFGDCKALICRHREDMIPPTLDLIMLGKKRPEVPPFVS